MDPVVVKTICVLPIKHLTIGNRNFYIGELHAFFFYMRFNLDKRFISSNKEIFCMLFVDCLSKVSFLFYFLVWKYTSGVYASEFLHVCAPKEKIAENSNIYTCN